MSSLYDDLPRRQPMARVWRGIIASVPPTVESLVSVILPDMSSELIFEDVRWSPRYEVAPIDVSGPGDPELLIDVPQLLLPGAGDLCLVVFDNNRSPWIVTWWPYPFDVPGAV